MLAGWPADWLLTDLNPTVALLGKMLRRVILGLRMLASGS